jgi:hypothetical protein
LSNEGCSINSLLAVSISTGGLNDCFNPKSSGSFKCVITLSGTPVDIHWCNEEIRTIQNKTFIDNELKNYTMEEAKQLNG